MILRCSPDARCVRHGAGLARSVDGVRTRCGLLDADDLRAIVGDASARAHQGAVDRSDPAWTVLALVEQLAAAMAELDDERRYFQHERAARLEAERACDEYAAALRATGDIR